MNEGTVAMNFMETAGIGVSVLLGWTASTIDRRSIRWLTLVGLMTGCLTHLAGGDIFLAWFYASVVLSCVIYRGVKTLEAIVQKSCQDHDSGSKKGD